MRYAFFACALALCASVASAVPITATSGTASFVLDTVSGFDGTPTANAVGWGTGDYMFEWGWWSRGPGETRETPLGVPTSFTGVGNVITLNYSALPGTLSGVSGTVVHTLVQSGALVTLNTDFLLTNLTLAPISFNMFSFVDLDVNGTAGQDTVTGGLGDLVVTDATAGGASYRSANATAFLVRPFAAATDVAGLLNDALVTNFDNSGLPANNIDVTLGYQYAITLGAGQSTTLNLVTTNSAAPLGNEVPEPGSVFLVGAGVLALSQLRRLRLRFR